MSASEDRGYLTTIAIVIAVTISCLAILLRFLARKLHKIPIGSDDYFILIGALFTIANALIYVWTNKYGNGRHLIAVRPENIAPYWKSFYISYQLYGAAITAIKISVLLFYRRLFSTPQFRPWIYSTGFVVIAWMFANNLAFAFQCSPIRKAWDVDINGHCVNPLTLIRIIQAFNVALDAAVLVLPVSAVLQLRLSYAKKLSVLAIFLLGGLSVIIAFIRLIIFTQVSLDDITYGTAKCSWTVIEPAIEVLSACLPTMAPLLKIRIRKADLVFLIRSPLSFNVGRIYESDESNKRGRQYSGELNGPNAQVWSQGYASHTEEATKQDQGAFSQESDDIPLRSIMVQHDVDWKETRIPTGSAVRSSYGAYGG